ncbi:MAG: CDP-alcohol phosphatidyltransferase family protein [Fidelibacterota bacterium]
MAEKVKITDPTRVLTLANLISLMRAMLAIPIIYSLRDPGHGKYTFALILMAVLSDALDGFFARKAHEVTHIGKWLDPIADFIVIITVVYFLVLFERFPAWFFYVYLIRYILIALPAIYLINHTDFVLQANWPGKWAAGITALTVTLHIFPIPWLHSLKIAAMVTAFILLIWSLAKYFILFIHELKKL